ncbi:MAG: NADH:ubiquinone oxidoreductase [Candidatus Aenigmarchaeota archaeon]|nr:NADH:ubiquinone oxidoreductase [Candidatus Aenigmarchaeota archaeon]
MMEHAPALVIAFPLFAAFASHLIGRLGSRIRDIWVFASLLLTWLFAVFLNLEVMQRGTYAYTLGADISSLASPAGFPVRIVLVIDGMSALIAFMAVSVTLASFIYSRRFMERVSGGGESADRYCSLVLLFLAGMLGMGLTGDFFTLFVFLEMTSISSASLVAFFRKGSSFEAAFKYMIISAINALFLLFGIGMIYSQYGLLNMAAIANEMVLNFSFLDKVALSLIVSAILLKLGSVPVHMWKVDVYQKVPSSVAVMCITSSLVGIYVLSRILFSVFFSMSALTGWMIVCLGSLSIIVGVSMALPQKDLKRMIAYASIAEIGYVMLGIGTGLAGMSSTFGTVALSGGVFHIINDALDLGLMFLIAGAVFYATGKTGISKLGGIAHRSASLSVLFIIGMLAVSGIPPFNGFVSKLIMYESVFCLNPVLSVIGILGSILMLSVFVKVFASVFLGSPYKGKFREIPLSMTAVMWIFALLIILLGLFPGLALDGLVSPAVEALLGHGIYMGVII